VKVFPNSVNDYFDIRFSETDFDVRDGEKMTLYNENGTQVDFIKEVEKLKDKEYRIRLTENPSGIYFLHILNNNKI
jgi:uncharacterized protein YajQ (UPF0234 family)